MGWKNLTHTHQLLCGSNQHKSKIHLFHRRERNKKACSLLFQWNKLSSFKQTLSLAGRHTWTTLVPVSHSSEDADWFDGCAFGYKHKACAWRDGFVQSDDQVISQIKLPRQGALTHHPDILNYFNNSKKSVVLLIWMFSHSWKNNKIIFVIDLCQTQKKWRGWDQHSRLL